LRSCPRARATAKAVLCAASDSTREAELDLSVDGAWLAALEHVVAELGEATTLRDAAKGPLRHPLPAIDSAAKFKRVRQLAAERRRAARRASPVVSRRRDQVRVVPGLVRGLGCPKLVPPLP